MATVITEEMLDALRARVIPYYEAKRYAHALAVEKEITRLGRVFMPERINELRAAALLHDITKAYSFKKQLQCAEEFGIISSMRGAVSAETLHAKTGAAVASRDFADIVNDDIVSAIKWHTTGRRGMTVFESLLYLADITEETRQHDSCRKARELLWASVGAAEDQKGRVVALAQTMVMTFDSTIVMLLSAGKLVETDTVEARNFFLVMLGDKN